MNGFERLIAIFSPETAERRAAARLRLRAYEAAKPTKNRKIANDRRTGTAVVREAAISIRTQARDLDENHDLAIGVLDVLVNNIIGRGLEYEPLIKTRKGELKEEINQKLIDLWEDWKRFPEVTDELNWSSVERLACRSWLRDGEVFAQLLTGIRNDLNHISKVPFSLELIEADYLPFGVGAGHATAIDGITRDDWGRAKKFWFSKRNNADLTPAAGNYSEIPAENVIHLKLAKRIRQNRGISIFAGVLKRLADIKDYEDYERIAAKIAASFAAAIKKGSPDSFNPETDAQDRDLRMQPGMIFDDLLPGESIEMIDSKRPNSALVPFRDGQLRAVASGTGSGSSSISKNYDNSYAAQRQEMLESSVHYDVMRDYFIARFSQRVWARFVDAAALAGAIKITPDIDKESLYDVEISGAGLPWLDPLKEVKAFQEYIKSGIKPKSQIQREYGINPSRARRQFIDERKKDDDAGLVFNSDYKHEQNKQLVAEVGAGSTD